jgi:hypothetical protein
MKKAKGVNGWMVFAWSLTALLCIVGTQVVYWTFTYPVNQRTDNWTWLSDDWMTLRAQWEYSHAASAALTLFALIALILSTLAIIKIHG